MVWFDVDIQLHLGTGTGWITTKGCRAAEVFQGEPVFVKCLSKVHQRCTNFKGTWDMDRTSARQQLFGHCFTQVLLAQVTQPTMPAWKDAECRVPCVFKNSISMSCVVGKSEKTISE